MTKTSIVLLAQHAKLTEACLSALHQHTPEDVELIVVNDGEQADIAQTMARYADRRFKVCATPALAGVAVGYNLGAAVASGEQIVFMRDHVTVTPDWLEGLSRVMDLHPDAAAVGPVSHGVSGAQQLDLPMDGLLRLPADQRSMVLTRGGEAHIRTNRLLSFLLLVDRARFHELGGFDEQFAMESYEDDDFCLRVLQADYGLYIARDVAVKYTAPPLLFPDDPSWYGRQLATNRELAAAKWDEDVSALLNRQARPVSVSLCMIVKNEEATLEGCLSSVADLIDEIVIVDTGSTDRTKAIAARFTDRIFDFEWVHDFSKARNYSFQQATGEYILWLDADDVFLAEDREKLRQLIGSLPYHADAVSMPYHLHRDQHGNVTSSIRRNRLVRRSMGYRWIGWVHEYLEVHGSILASEVAVTHNRVHQSTTRNLELYEARISQGDQLGPRDTYYYANELYDHGRWAQAAEQYEQLLKLPNVWVEDRIGACGKAAECYIQLQQLEDARLKALQSFSYALPRAENCCRLGQIFLSEQRYHEAIYWYETAAQLKMPTDSSALMLHAYWTWLPQLQLCVCYDRIGDYARSYAANERAAVFLPDDQRIIDNRAYLQKQLEAAR